MGADKQSLKWKIKELFPHSQYKEVTCFEIISKLCKTFY